MAPTRPNFDHATTPEEMAKYTDRELATRALKIATYVQHATSELHRVQAALVARNENHEARLRRLERPPALPPQAPQSSPAIVSDAMTRAATDAMVKILDLHVEEETTEVRMRKREAEQAARASQQEAELKRARELADLEHLQAQRTARRAAMRTILIWLCAGGGFTALGSLLSRACS